MHCDAEAPFTPSSRAPLRHAYYALLLMLRHLSACAAADDAAMLMMAAMSDDAITPRVFMMMDAAMLRHDTPPITPLR